MKPETVLILAVAAVLIVKTIAKAKTQAINNVAGAVTSTATAVSTWFGAED